MASDLFMAYLVLFMMAKACALNLQSENVAGTKNDELTSKYYWPHARGHPGRYSTTMHTGPSDLNASLSWSWHHPEGRYHTVVLGGPLIDDKKNIYIASSDGFRKFNLKGDALWYYPVSGTTVAYCPSLMDGTLFGSSQDGTIYAIDMETGKSRWTQKKAENAPGDTGYTESHDGVVFAGVNSGPGGGAMTILGLDAKSGDELWRFDSSNQIWNFMAVFPGDDSAIFMDIHGGVYKHAIHNSTLLWYAKPPSMSNESFSDGGVMVGPDGTAYTCSNYEGSGSQGQPGALRAYRLSDGKMIWNRFLEYPCNSWPAVTEDGSSVIVPIGAFVASPAASDGSLMSRFKKNPEDMNNFSLSLGDKELSTYGQARKTAAIQAFDAKTGERLWSTELPPYGRLAAVGDEEGFIERRDLHVRDQCLPAQFSSPTISGDGTVYVGRADGGLYAVNQHMFTKFDAGAGALHPGTSWAPGMMAFITCDGLFVWNY